MDSLTLKLIITPTLVGLATLVGRRWGPAVSGWLVGIPFTSGPISFFLALSQGTTFAASVAVGTLTGVISQAIFCLAYGWLALRVGWRATILLCCLIFFIATAALQFLSIPVFPLFVLCCLSLIIALALMPKRQRNTGVAVKPLPAAPTRSDLPARMVIATAFVLVLTGIAPLIGARLTGLIAPFPLYTSILAVFAHRREGSAPAINVVRGLLYGLFGFSGFFLVLATQLPSLGIAPAFGLALAVSLLAQAVTLLIIRRAPKISPI